MKIKNYLVLVLVLATISVGYCSRAINVSPESDSAREVATAYEMQLREDMAGHSRVYIGSRYRRGGKTPKTGVDCSGFTAYVYGVFNLDLSAGSSDQARRGKAVPLSKVQQGDLVFFGYRGRITHVAMVVKNEEDGISVIHSTSSKGVIIQNISKSKYWKPKILFARDVISENKISF